ncbi:RlpA-like double-psi beta-barrel domain-containing protein [Nonomuraea lactucae]|uniref:RlpA-like double-psi beta-barrel domain-containing protein n=1 Tax=Nonomuraea lactucae TaxID=2249762 RepID=UPI0013B37625|nr:RlpA-like double-psi beta-barrel domain-containing protein [Nonomuraea lactucae]
MSVLALWSAVLTAGPASASAVHYGDGTWYNTGVGACGWNNNDGQLVVAISPRWYGNQPNPNNSPACGKQLRVRGPLGVVYVTIVDKCPSCKTDDLDLSPAAFRQIADLNAGRVRIQWVWA